MALLGTVPTSSSELLSGGALGLAAAYVDLVYIQLMIIYLFLSWSMDIGAILLLAQGFVPIVGFANPIFTSTSARIFWGKRWNLQVTSSFKRCVFTPLSKGLKLSPTLAALITFIASGLFHEYQFVLSFPTYRLGRISLFFVLHGLLCAADAIVSKSAGKALAPIPWQLKAFCVVLFYCPTVPMFSSIWIEEGFFHVIARLSFLVQW